MDLYLLDTVLRGTSIALLALVAVLFWVGEMSKDARNAITMVAVCETAHLISCAPGFLDNASDPLMILCLIGAGGAFALTWLTLTVFLDAPEQKRLWLASGAVTSAGILLAITVPETLVPMRALAILHFGALLALAITTAVDDLVDCRIKIRPVFAIALSALCIALSFTASPETGPPTVYHALIHSLGCTLAIGVFALWVLRPVPSHWPEPKSSVSPSAPIQSPAQAALTARIDAAMRDGIWRQEGLTVAMLATAVGAPEHRVRKAINQGLGHRNFASFINQRRINAAKARLRSPRDAETTVLEIAYEVGFGSLGPFNRAFRAETGVSPTEFRRGSNVAGFAETENNPSEVKSHV